MWYFFINLSSKIFNFFDSDKDGKIDLDEFMNALRQDAKQGNKKNKYRELFKGEKE